MILGIGIDLIEIDRFALWHSYPLKRLQKVFSEHEIEYSRQEVELSPERFAARFAAKEALYKALCTAMEQTHFPFAATCSSIHVVQRELQAPRLEIDWDTLQQLTPLPKAIREAAIHLSLTHSNGVAGAFVVLEKLYD